MVVMVSEELEPATSNGLTAPSERVKALDPHRNSLKPRFDIVSLIVVKMTAQFTTIEGSPVASSIDEKSGVRDILFLGEPMEERRRGIGVNANGCGGQNRG